MRTSKNKQSLFADGTLFTKGKKKNKTNSIIKHSAGTQKLENWDYKSMKSTPRAWLSIQTTRLIPSPWPWTTNVSGIIKRERLGKEKPSVSGSGVHPVDAGEHARGLQSAGHSTPRWPADALSLYINIDSAYITAPHTSNAPKRGPGLMRPSAS